MEMDHLLYYAKKLVFADALKTTIDDQMMEKTKVLLFTFSQIVIEDCCHYFKIDMARDDYLI